MPALEFESRREIIMAYRRFNRSSSYRPRESAPQREDIRIEYPSRGATYCRQEYGVYRYDTYASNSVLAGQQRRTFLASYPTLEAAKAAYPNASSAGCGYQPPYLGHLPEGNDC